MKKTLDEQIEQEALKEIKGDSKDKAKINYLASFPNLVDIVENEDNNFEYLVFDPTNDKCFTTPVIEIDKKTYEPPPKKLLPKNMVFPRKEYVLHYIAERKTSLYQSISNHINVSEDSEDMRNLEKKSVSIFEWDVALYDDIVSYYKERAELPNDELYDVMTVWAFHTYAMERASFSPIIYFLGLPEKGKSRMLKSMIWIARRGLRKISITDAQILRDCTDLDATLAMDMMDLWKKIDKAGSEDVFLNRPEKGIDVSRVNRPEKGAFADTDYYTVFGPTLFATNEMVHEILETRAIPVIMTNSTKSFDTIITAQDGLMLKEKLTAWRASTMGDVWEPVKRIAKSRLGDITQPLYQVVKYVNPAREEAFIKTIKEIERKRTLEKADSISGQIIQAVSKLKGNVEHGYLKSQLITNEFNKDKLNDREKVSSRKILNKLKTMGFESTMGSGGWMAIVWDDKKLEALQAEYGIENIDFSENPLDLTNLKSSQTSLTPEKNDQYYMELAETEEPI